LLLRIFHLRALEYVFFEYAQFPFVSQTVELTQKKFCGDTKLPLAVGIVAQPKFQLLNVQIALSTPVIPVNPWQKLVLAQNLDQTHHQIERERDRACWARVIETTFVV
jgi:hypothetical protein